MLLSLHQQLDAVVAEGYGGPAVLPEAEMLVRLVQFYHQRQQQETAGQMRCLHPTYESPETVAS